LAQPELLALSCGVIHEAVGVTFASGWDPGECYTISVDFDLIGSSACEHGCSTRTALGTGAVGFHKIDSLFGNAIDVGKVLKLADWRRGVHKTTVMRISHDEEEVWLFGDNQQHEFTAP